MTILGRLIPWWVGPLAGAAIVAGLWFWHTTSIAVAEERGREKGVEQCEADHRAATERTQAELDAMAEAARKSAEAALRQRTAREAAERAAEEAARAQTGPNEFCLPLGSLVLIERAGR